MEHHSLDIEVIHSENFSGFTLAQNLLQPESRFGKSATRLIVKIYRGKKARDIVISIQEQYILELFKNSF